MLFIRSVLCNRSLERLRSDPSEKMSLPAKRGIQIKYRVSFLSSSSFLQKSFIFLRLVSVHGLFLTLILNHCVSRLKYTILLFTY